VKLNLGCSDRLLDGYLNVDIAEPADVCVDLSKPWPWPDNSAEEILADDLIEHLPDKILTMNEAWRVLKPGGMFKIFVPTTEGRGAFQDPGHKSYWNRNSFFYYTDGIPERERFGESYGIKARYAVTYEMEKNYPNQVRKLEIWLKAVK
jgi:ubiquinone/menaquinone biosynthesis C-methylase UbiE